MTPWLTLNQEFERRRKESKTKPGDKRKLDQVNTIYLLLFYCMLLLLFDQAKKEKKRPGGRLRGFERRLDPERIVGATDSSGELMFLIKVILRNEYIQYTQKTTCQLDMVLSA